MGKVKISLTEDQRQYIINESIYSRVSDIAKAGPNVFLEQWKNKVGEQEAIRIATEAADYGELVHDITMWNDLGKKRKVDAMLLKDEFLLPSLLAWQDWVERCIKKWILIEQLVWSERLRAAGRIDRVSIMVGDDEPSIQDIKTGGMWDTIGVQLGGYSILYSEMLKRGAIKFLSPLSKWKKMEARRRLAVSLPRKEPGKLNVKEYSEDRFLVEFESKAELFKSMNQ